MGAVAAVYCFWLSTRRAWLLMPLFKPVPVLAVGLVVGVYLLPDAYD